MNIVHIGPSVLPALHRYGGAVQRRMTEIAREQAARGHRVVVYSAGVARARSDYHGVEVRTVPCRRGGLLGDVQFLRAALRDLDGDRVDVLHCQNLPEGAAFTGALRARRVFTYDYFILRRGRKTPLFFAYRQLLRRFDALLPVSRFCLNETVRYWRLDPALFTVVHNGVNLDQFKPDPQAGATRKQELGLEGKQVVLYAGRVCAQKGTDLLVAAWRRVRGEFPDARLVVAGPAGQFGLSGENSLTGAIRDVGGIYLGAVEERLLPSIYNMCDLFCMPTREYEMFGMAAAEAQACGKAVLCSRHGGLPEVVPESSGRYFACGNVEDLVTQLRSLLADPFMVVELSQSARSNAMRFAWSRIVDQLERIYGSILQGSASS